MYHSESRSITHQKWVVLQFLRDVTKQSLQGGKAASKAMPAHLELEVGQEEVARFRLKEKIVKPFIIADS